MTGHLIVTADDVGLHEGLTLGAVEAHRRGIVTACSVAANGGALSHAIEQLRECPQLESGAHLLLVEGRPLRPPATVPSLVDRGGALLADHRAFTIRYALGRVSLREVEDECRAQLELLLERGLRLTHVNSHQHLHALPRVNEIVSRLAREYSIPYVRTPRDGRPPRATIGRRLAVHALGMLATRSRRWADQFGRTTNDTALGIADAGHLDRERIRQLLDRPLGVAELVTHPGTHESALAGTFRWRYQWERETGALCDPGLRTYVQSRGWILVAPSALGGQRLP